MRRKTSHFLSAILFVAAIVLSIAAVRSASHADALVFNISRGAVALVSNRGVQYLVATNLPVWNLQEWSVHFDQFPTEELLGDRDEMVAAADWQMGYAVTRPANTVERKCWGFSIGKGTDSSTMPGKWYAFASAPAWALIPLLLLLPLRATSNRIRRWRRGKRGQCLACGYDLRESPGRCPECGFVALAMD